jgi:Tfp pilus assembly protein FimT
MTAEVFAVVLLALFVFFAVPAVAGAYRRRRRAVELANLVGHLARVHRLRRDRQGSGSRKRGG